MPEAVRAPRTQQQRRDETRRALLDAAVESLIEVGFARTNAVLELLWQCFSGTFFQVAMELRTAARTDPELRPVLVAAERALRDRIVMQSKALFGKDVGEHPGLERALDFTLQFFIGSAMSAVLHADPRINDLIEDFKALFPAVLTQATTKRRTKVVR